MRAPSFQFGCLILGRVCCLALALGGTFRVVVPPATFAQTDRAGRELSDNQVRPASGPKPAKSNAPYPKSDSTDRKSQILKASHWAFQPIRNPPPPAVQATTWPRTSVDPFILARIEALGATPAAPADRRTLLRRATFDLLGLPPAPEEVEAFLADGSPDAFAAAIDRLLNSPHYGERWGRHWLDVVRYADTAGETADYPVPVAWRYRNYVIDAFNADKPYLDFLREQIAGDLLARRGPRERYAERVTATGFLAISRRFGFDSENYHHLTIQDTIDTLGQTVLGLSLGCARCHDHKYDPVPATDYYALYGIFDSTRYAFPGSEQKQKYRALVPLLPVEEAQPKWRAFDARVAALTHQLEKLKQSVPGAVLRSLDDLDGDFELQAIAAGGSKGVLVPPWVSEGRIAVTKEAQSPFKNLYPLGKVGASIPATTNAYRIAQALHPRRAPGRGATLHVNLDFRVSTNDHSATGAHRFWLGSRIGFQPVTVARASPPASGPGGAGTLPVKKNAKAGNRSGRLEARPAVDSSAVEIFISSQSISLRAGGVLETLRALKPNQWCNLQLVLDLHARTVSGTIGAPDDLITFASQPWSPPATGTLDVLAFDSGGSAGLALPGIDLDNLAVQESSLPPVALTAPEGLVSEGNPEDKPEIERTRQELNALLADGPCDMTYGVVEGTPHNARMQLRGEPDKPGDEVPRGFLQVLGGELLPRGALGSGRLELADWLTRSGNPLTARVMANRIWQYHFGQGLVKTPNDFGLRGLPPTHPELLDHLATKFIQSGWSIKAMHRLIMLSATYQQESRTGGRRQEAGAADRRQGRRDTDSRLLSPDSFTSFPRRRLSAEELRDAILRASGELEATPGHGHPFTAPTGWGYTQHSPFSAVYDHHHRSVYLMTQRLKRHPLLALFDGADPNASTAERRATTVPTQALFFLNDPFVHAKSEKFAHWLQHAGEYDAQRIAAAYRRALGRNPTETERGEAAEFLAAYSFELRAAKQDNVETKTLAAFARALFGSNEFLHVD